LKEISLKNFPISLDDIYKPVKRNPYELWASILAFCPLKEFLCYKYQPNTLFVKDSLLAGRFIHLLLQKMLEERGYKLEHKVVYSLFGKWVLAGRIDAINSNEVVEIKTVKTFDGLKKYWVDQITLYMHMSNIHNGKIVVIERSTGKIVEYEIKYDESRAKKLIEIAKIVAKALVKEDITLVPCAKDERCKHCEFNFICSLRGDRENADIHRTSTIGQG